MILVSVPTEVGVEVTADEWVAVFGLLELAVRSLRQTEEEVIIEDDDLEKFSEDGLRGYDMNVLTMVGAFMTGLVDNPELNVSGGWIERAKNTIVVRDEDGVEFKAHVRVVRKFARLFREAFAIAVA